jgi:hypothetical protein
LPPKKGDTRGSGQPFQAKLSQNHPSCATSRRRKNLFQAQKQKSKPKQALLKTRGYRLQKATKQNWIAREPKYRKVTNQNQSCQFVSATNRLYKQNVETNGINSNLPTAK